MGCKCGNDKNSISKGNKKLQIYDKTLQVQEIQEEKFIQDQLPYFQIFLRDFPEQKINAPIKIINQKYFEPTNYTSILQASLYYRAFSTSVYLFQDKYNQLLILNKEQFLYFNFYYFKTYDQEDTYSKNSQYVYWNEDAMKFVLDTLWPSQHSIPINEILMKFIEQFNFMQVHHHFHIQKMQISDNKIIEFLNKMITHPSFSCDINLYKDMLQSKKGISNNIKSSHIGFLLMNKQESKQISIDDLIKDCKTFCFKSQHNLFGKTLEINFDKFCEQNYQDLVDYIYMECNANETLLKILLRYSTKIGLEFDKENFKFNKIN